MASKFPTGWWEWITRTRWTLFKVGLSASGRLKSGSRRTIASRSHRALLLCRVMSAKSKSASAARKVQKKPIVQSAVPHLSANSAGSPERDAELFAHGVTLFNTRYFFEAHEAWEEIWLHTAPPEKTFLQGLIQVTAAFHHHSRENLRGTKSLLRTGLLKLEDFPPHHRGLHIEKLRKIARRWLEVLNSGKTVSWPALPKISPAPNNHK